MGPIRQTIKKDHIEVIRTYQGGYFKVLISPEQTGGTMALVDMTLPKGGDPPLHIHSREDETFYMIEGALTFFIGETVIKASAGEAVFAPRQVPHQFKIESEKARFLILITPGQFLEYFLEFSFPTAEEAKIMPLQDPPAAEMIAYMTSKLIQTYGVLLM